MPRAGEARCPPSERISSWIARARSRKRAQAPEPRGIRTPGLFSSGVDERRGGQLKLRPVPRECLVDVLDITKVEIVVANIDQLAALCPTHPGASKSSADHLAVQYD